MASQSVMFSLKFLLIKKKTLRPLSMDGLQMAQGYGGTTRTLYFWSPGLPGTDLVNFGR